MPRNKGETPRTMMDRVSKLERRMRILHQRDYKDFKTIGEISALEWAIPILEEYVNSLTDQKMYLRQTFYSHEKKMLVAKIQERQGDVCYLCNLVMSPRETTIDHVVPLSKGGTDGVGNYKLAHRECNIEKGNYSLDEYLELKRKLSND